MLIKGGTVIKARKLAFDMDGTLIDTRGVIEWAWKQWANKHGLSVLPILDCCHGRRASETIALFSDPSMNIEAEAEQVAKFVETRLDELSPTPGALELLRSLPPECWGLVTSAERQIADRWMRHLGFPIPRVFIAAEDVAAGKPNPMPYVVAAQALGCHTDELLVFEDSVAGLISAELSGASVIAVGRHSESYRRWVPDFLALRFAEGFLHVG